MTAEGLLTAVTDYPEYCLEAIPTVTENEDDFFEVQDEVVTTQKKLDVANKELDTNPQDLQDAEVAAKLTEYQAEKKLEGL